MVEFDRLKQTADQLIQRAEEGGLVALDQVLNTTVKTAATYRYSYDRFVQYFLDRSESEPLNEQDLYIGFAMAHSWMATIKQLDPSVGTTRAAVSALNQARNMGPGDIVALINDQDTAGELARLVTGVEPLRLFLGSVTAASRLLHFANPTVFPMWDAVIHRYCETAAVKSTSDSLHRYLEYVLEVHRLVSDPRYDLEIYEPVTLHIQAAHAPLEPEYRAPARMGKVRTVEFLMFFGGRLEHLAGTD